MRLATRVPLVSSLVSAAYANIKCCLGRFDLRDQRLPKGSVVGCGELTIFANSERTLKGPEK